MDKNKTIIRATTVVCVRDDKSVVIASDGQVTLGTSVIKSNANTIRTFHNDQIIVGFAGSTADALTLFDRLEKKCEEDSKWVVVGKCSGERVDDHTKLKSQYGCDLVLKNNQNQFWMLNKVIDAEFEEL